MIRRSSLLRWPLPCCRCLPMPPTCCRSTKWRATAIRSCPPPNRPGWSTRKAPCRRARRLLPQINGQATLNRTRSEPNADINSGSFTNKRRNYTIDGSQTLFNWTQINNLRSQRELSKAADFTLESANDSLIVRTSAAYFNVLVAIESLNAAQTNEAAAKKQFDFADKRLEVGLAPITDVHEARAQYDQARANTIVAQNTLADNYQALTELTGQPVVNLRGLPADFRPEVPANRGNIDELVHQATTQNPALKAQELKVSAAEAGVQAARGGHYPTLSLGGSWGKTATWGDSTGSGSLSPMPAPTASA